VFTPFSATSIVPVFDGYIEAGDIDGDGDNDLIVTGGTDSGAVAKVYVNDGLGNFSETGVDSLAALSDASVVLSDIDQDADLDIVMFGLSGAADVSRVYMNNGAGEFEISSTSALTPLSDPVVTAGDVNGDGANDLLVSGYSANQYALTVYLNDGLGGFSSQNLFSEIAPERGSHSAQFGDIDNDSDRDIVALYYNGAYRFRFLVFENSGAGVFTLISSRNVTADILSEGYANFHLSDFDADGDADILLAHNATLFRHWAGSTGFLINDGTGAFSELVRFTMPSKEVEFCVSRINNDDLFDIVVVGELHAPDGIYIGPYQPASRMMLNLGDMNFDADIVSGIIGYKNAACVLADVNGDGKNDLLVSGYAGTTENGLSGAAAPVFHIYTNKTSH
jgi:hypothetical protein